MSEYQEGFEDAIFAVSHLLDLLSSNDLSPPTLRAIKWHMYVSVQDPRKSLVSEKDQTLVALIRAKKKLQRKHFLLSLLREE